MDTYRRVLPASSQTMPPHLNSQIALVTYNPSDIFPKPFRHSSFYHQRRRRHQPRSPNQRLKPNKLLCSEDPKSNQFPKLSSSRIQKRSSKPSQPITRKLRKAHSHASDKDQNKRHHPLDVNTLKGHGDAVTGLCFSSDGRSLATACADGVIRVFKLEDASSKSFKFLRINLPAGGHPTALAFSEGASSIVVASQTLSGCSLYLYGRKTL
ncbi:hypothetical protein FNV43_RR18532 [Rhamnella rubrinervis]|uniref:Uncharacterized protein n=1 Tax=Rhamnella rubrinervis TaxID=2594499 RepID=A0A8K0E615_9ROSA|nr:hypothetical protein FNV43_RR18532 [Rhamnella rubrinervis]